MNNNVKKVREPFCHITKRVNMVWYKAWAVRLIAIFFALVVCGLMIFAMTGLNPIKVYTTMFEGTFGTPRRIWTTIQNTSMLLCIALAVTPAFKMRFWNIGAEGQVLMGGLGAAACMFYIGDKLPSWLLLVIMLVVSILAGLIWGIIPAFFKANWNTNETLFTLMMNYVAIQLVSFFINVWVPNGSNVMGIINAETKAGWLPILFKQKAFLPMVIVIVLTVLMYIYLKHTKQGYEIAVVGESENTARYVGINVKKVIMRTMAISGALCGLAGLIAVSGVDYTITKDTAGGNGFTAIIVSWLAKFNPIIMMLTAFLIEFLKKGAGQIATEPGINLNESIADIVTAIILFFIIGCEFFVNYKLNFRKKSKKS